MSAWDNVLGTAGGNEFGAALARNAAERDVDTASLAAALGRDEAFVNAVVEGTQRVGIAALARLCTALRLRPIECLQRLGILSLEAYAFGLDPLYFLPEGQVRYDARIYMREINPRHRVPEGDMTRRNPTIKQITDDAQLDAAGKVELELAYLLRLASQELGGTL